MAAYLAARRRALCRCFPALVVLLHSAQAFGFCRTTTCDPGVEDCARDENTCVTSGQPLFWPDLCVTFGTQANGSPLRGISYQTANEISERAFRSWISATCPGGNHPSIGAVPLGPIVCDRPEFNTDSEAVVSSEDSLQTQVVKNQANANANVIMFRDDMWPYSGPSRTIALTTVTFDVASGEILDADIEVNSFGMQLSTSETDITNDLQSVLTHEVGHFLGLAHSSEPAATMNRSYDQRGDLSFRTLNEDDERAICFVYPPGYDLDSCRGAGPRYGFSRYCAEPYEEGSCSVSTRPTSDTNLLFGIAGVALFSVRRRRYRAAL